MALTERAYQTRTVDAVVARWRMGPCRIAVVAPTGCLTGDAIISVNRGGKGFKLSLRDLVHRFNGGMPPSGAAWNSNIPTMARARLDSAQVGLVEIIGAYESGMKEVFEVRLESGHRVRATADHKFLTARGWLRLGDIKVGEDSVEYEPSARPQKSCAKKKKNWSKLRSAKLHPHRGRRGVAPSKGGNTVAEHRLSLEARMNGLGLEEYISRVNHGPIEGLVFLDPSLHVHHLDHDHHNNAPSNLVAMSNAEHQREHRDHSLDAIAVRARLSRVVAIAHVGKEMTYDLSMAGPNNFLANGIVVHNSGKTAMGCLIIARYPEQRFVWLAHTRDLVEQSAAALEREFPGEVGVVMSGHPAKPFARIQVCSVQTLIARGFVPEGWVVFDEMHHYGAEEWNALAEKLSPYAVGLTATPERQDGVGLRGLFQDLTVAAHYSELIAGGFIVPCRVLRPAKRLRGIAQDPVTAYLKHGEGRHGFTFCRTIEIARDVAAKYTAFGVPATCVDAETPAEERRAAIAGLGKQWQMLTSVYALTEGVDVPSASVCVLARGIGHGSGLCQMAGRVLRASVGKTDALLLDLPGVTWELGLPHEDREYSLDGMKRREGAESVRVCQACGYCELSGVTKCTRCGFKLPAKELRPKVTNEELAERAGRSDLEKQLHLSTLIAEAKRSGKHDDWVALKYKSIYGKYPELPHDVERKQELYEKLKRQARAAGWSVARAAVLFKSYYGEYPPRSW